MEYREVKELMAGMNNGDLFVGFGSEAEDRAAAVACRRVGDHERAFLFESLVEGQPVGFFYDFGGGR